MQAPTRTTWALSALGMAALVLGVGSCNSAITDSNRDTATSTGGGNANANLSLGLDPGVALSGAEVAQDPALAGVDLADGRKIIFVAFSTTAPADRDDGSGVRLVKDEPAPADANGLSDIFLAAIDVSAGTSFRQSLLSVFRNERCERCHGFHAPDTTVPNHPGGHPGNNENCRVAGCHDPSDIGIPSDVAVPMEPEDRAPIFWEAPDPEFDFRGLSVEELCEVAMRFPEGRTGPVDHLHHDDKVRWAFLSGVTPAGTTPKPRVDLDYATFRERVTAWADGGFECNSAELLDVVLVSQSAAGAGDRAANGSSRRPTITWVPAGAGGVVGAGGRDLLGYVHVAFVTEATDLVPGASSNGQQIVRFRVPVYGDEDPSGAALAKGINLDMNPALVSPLLVSATAAQPNLGGDSSSDAPRISGDGRWVAFESRASNLVDGFVDSNGLTAADVFVRHLGRADTRLVSAAAGMPAQGGNGASSSPALTESASFVAFASSANDLIDDDTNGVTDVFYAPIAGRRGGVGDRVRASVTSSGAEAGGGNSGAPSVYQRPDGSLIVVFESAARGLVSGFGSLPAGNVYLHDGRDATTTLLSRTSTGAAPNGVSRQPVITPNGNQVLFSSLASNLDSVRPEDQNGVEDVFAVGLASLFASGSLEPERLSIADNGADGDGAATGPVAGRVVDGRGEVSSFAAFASNAANLTTSTNTQTVLVFVNNPPICNFSSPTSAVPGERISFDPSTSSDPDSGDTIESYVWDFGDGSDPQTRDNADPIEHIFEAGIDRTVTLTVTDTRGAVSTCVRAVAVNTPPECVFEVSPVPTRRDTVLTFDATGSTDADGDALSYAWNFGDGVTATTQVAEHTYTAIGPRTVTLTITDARGAMSSCQVMLNIIGLADTPPDCRWTLREGVGGPVLADNATTYTGQTIAFDASATTDADGLTDPDSWSWDFGDGATATGPTTTHAYADDGTYTITLTVTDDLGAPCTLMRTLRVGARFSEVHAILLGCGCHGTVIPPVISDNQTTTFGNLVGATSGCVSSQDIVTPGNPTASQLLIRVERPISGTPCTGSMPPGGTALTAEQIAAIRSWIVSGAANN